MESVQKEYPSFYDAFFLKTQMNALLLLSNKDLISLWLSSKLLEVRFQKPQMMYKGPRNMFTVFFKC